MERDDTFSPKPLHFDQPAEFYVRRSLRHREKGDLPEALQDLRCAGAKDPDNWEILLDMADLLCDMGRYDQSNEWLLMHLHLPAMKNPEVYCLMGRNFLYLGEWEQARECLNLTLNMEPDEDTEFQAMGMLETLEEQLAFEEEENDVPPQLHLVGELPQRMSGEEMLYAAALHAQQGKIDEAIRCLDQRARTFGEDMQGLCAKAVFCIRADRAELGEKALQRAMEIYPESPKELILLADTLGLLERHEDVLRVTEPLLEAGWGHFMLPQVSAMAYYNTGNYKKAQQIWNRMLLIDPEDEVLRWYFAQAGRALAGSNEYPTLPYMVALPRREIYLKAQKLQAIFSRDMTPEQLRENPEFAATIRWLLEVDDDADHASLLHALYLIQGRQAEPLFRRMLVRRSISARAKRLILGYLQEMGVPGPYIMLVDEGVVEAMPTGEVLELDEVQYRVEQLLLEHFAELPDEDRERIQIIWRQLCAYARCLRRIRKPEPWAAAMHYLLLQYGSYGVPLTQKQTADLYGVSPAAVSDRIGKLEVVIRGQDET